MGDWLPLVAVLAVGVAYVGTRLRTPRPGKRVAPAAFAGGLLTTAVALSPPFHGVADRSFAGHMVQHVLLISVAAPLLVLGEPGTLLLHALAPARRRRWRAATAGARRSVRLSEWGPWAVGAVIVQAAVMWTWHAPNLFESALRSDAIHGLEHVTLLTSSMAVWWSLLRGRRSHRGAAALALFVGAFPGTALGAALLLAPRPWFPSYAHGGAAAALADQQLAGVIMWSIAGMAYVVGAAILFGTWLARDESHRPAGPLTRAREGDTYAY